MKWTKEKDEILISLLTKGKSYNQISVLFNTTSNSVRNRCGKLKIKSSDYKIKSVEKFNCKNCNKEFTDRIHRKFCSHSCSASYNNKNKIKHEKKICLNCGNNFTKGKYCSHECQFKYQYNEYIRKWKNNEVDGTKGTMKDLSRYLRRYLFDKYDNKCSMCGWNQLNVHTQKIPLEVDHIDGNYKNNKEENLRLICPNCHSLTENYGSRNKGNGREYRRNYRKKDDIA